MTAHGFNKRLRKTVNKCSEAQNHRCCYCHMITYSIEELAEIFYSLKKFKVSMLDMMTAEHIIKQEHGKQHGYHNIVMSCMLCNSLRQNRDPIEHYEWVQNNLNEIIFRKKAARGRIHLPNHLKLQGDELYEWNRKRSRWVNDHLDKQRGKDFKNSSKVSEKDLQLD